VRIFVVTESWKGKVLASLVCEIKFPLISIESGLSPLANSTLNKIGMQSASKLDGWGEEISEQAALHYTDQESTLKDAEGRGFMHVTDISFIFSPDVGSSIIFFLSSA
jgi:hypothetical protein